MQKTNTQISSICPTMYPGITRRCAWLIALPSSPPFAALTGHDAAISEAARLTDEQPIPDESVEQDIFQILCLGIMIKCDVFLFHTQINYPSLRCNPPIALNSHVDEVIK